MQTFNFPYHKQSTKYPENSFRVTFGGGYQFVSKPQHKGQRIFTLYFTGMKFYLTNGVINNTDSPTLNMQKLIEFYEAHELYEPFTYPHPVFGNVTVRFNTPLEIPKGYSGGTGVVEDFQIELIEQP